MAVSRALEAAVTAYPVGFPVMEEGAGVAATGAGAAVETEVVAAAVETVVVAVAVETAAEEEETEEEVGAAEVVMGAANKKYSF